MSSNTTALPTRSTPSDNQNTILATKPVSCLGHLQAIAPRLTHMGPNDSFPSRRRSQPCTAKHLGDLKVELGNETLWKMFHVEEHEMKVTNKGRLLFPSLKLKMSGLSPSEKYRLTVNFANIDSARYRYCPMKNEWFQWCTKQLDQAANAGRRLYEHPSSPAFGAVWTDGVITFDNLRLTNDWDKVDKHMIQVSTLRKYRIQVIVTKLQCVDCHQPHVRMVELPLTEFIAVTGYRNNKMKQLKIDKNPCSVAFRNEYKILRAARKRNNEFHDVKRACKMTKVDDVISTAVKPPNCSWEESSVVSCFKQSPESLTSCRGQSLGTLTSCRGQFPGTLTSCRGQSPRTLTSCCGQSPGALTSCCGQSPGTLTSCCGQSSGTLTSCCVQSPTSLTPSTPSIDLHNHVSTFLQNDVFHYPQNDLILHPQFHQPLYSNHDDMNRELDIPKFEIPDMNTHYPRLIQPQEECTYGEMTEVDQSYCYKYEDFTTPFQYTEWDTVYC